MQAAQTLGKS